MSLLLSVVLLLSCGGDKKTPECVDHGDCPSGNACVQNACKEVDCLASSDCDIYQFCNPFFECQEGCEKDSDCQAGETCDKTSHSCSIYGCRSTDLDCEYGEFCDTESGECYEGEGQWCEAGCNARNIYSCSSGRYCLQFVGQDDAYCYRECENEGDCPRGFECGEIDLGLESVSVCYADCDYMIESGYL